MPKKKEVNVVSWQVIEGVKLVTKSKIALDDIAWFKNIFFCENKKLLKLCPN